MKFTLCIIALTIMVSVEALPAPASTPIVLPDNAVEFFDNKLKSVQGAIYDTLRAGKDLQDMEGKLQDIVNQSSYFFLTESATEYAVNKDAYENSWAGKQFYRYDYCTKTLNITSETERGPFTTLEILFL